MEKLRYIYLYLFFPFLFRIEEMDEGFPYEYIAFLRGGIRFT